jgi:hypothetical protein
MPHPGIKRIGGALIGLLALAVAVVLITRPPHAPVPADSRPAESNETLSPPASVAAPAPRVSRSRGQDDWAFFFRAGDTLSRMPDGSTLGTVVRTEKRHGFPDGSSGPAYVVRGPDQREGVFDADELERSARIESVRDIRIPAPPAAKASR